MASNLDYLDPSLQPLEDKLQAYLQTEKDLQRAEVEATNLAHQGEPHTTGFDQRPPTGNYPQQTEEVRFSLENLRDDLQRLQQEIIGLLPVRDEWVKVNLGYGPSRVGAFRKADATDAASEYELRVVI